MVFQEYQSLINENKTADFGLYEGISILDLIKMPSDELLGKRFVNLQESE